MCQFLSLICALSTFHFSSSNRERESISEIQTLGPSNKAPKGKIFPPTHQSIAFPPRIKHKYTGSHIYSFLSKEIRGVCTLYDCKYHFLKRNTTRERENKAYRSGENTLNNERVRDIERKK